jgi:hypothetical protein
VTELCEQCIRVPIDLVAYPENHHNIRNYLGGSGPNPWDGRKPAPTTSDREKRSSPEGRRAFPGERFHCSIGPRNETAFLLMER